MTPSLLSAAFMSCEVCGFASILRCDVTSSTMHVIRPAADDLALRLDQLERVLQDSRATLRGADAESTPLDRSAMRIAAALDRIKRLTALVQSSLVRSDPDLVDRLVMQLLLADYTDVVAGLRASTDRAAGTLKDAATTIAATERLLRGDAKSRD